MESEKKRPQVSARIIKASEKPVVKAEGPTQLDSAQEGSASQFVSPMYPMLGLKRLVQESNILPQCIAAYRNNIVGFGIGLRYTVDEGDETAEMKAEWDRAQEIIDLLNLDRDTKEVFESVIEARETYGIAYLEVMRNPAGEVNQIDFIHDTPSISKTYPLDPPVMVEYNYKGQKTIQRPRRFCKYKQQVGGRTIYFKEFGDPRMMDNRSGEYVGTGEEDQGNEPSNPDETGSTLEVQYQANEIIDFPIGTEIYGEVRWMGQMLGVDGARRAESLNNSYFSKGRHTPLMIMVQGGTLTDDSFMKLQEYMNEIQGEKGQHAFLVLEMENTDNQAGFEQGKTPQIEVKDLASILQKDELFQDYIENGRKRVQSAFRLPDLYTGYTTDFNRATAQTAMEVTEEQVFQPERKSLAWVINNRLLNEYGFKYVEAYFLSPDISNPDDLFKILSITERAGGLTPNKAKTILGNALGEKTENFEGEWADTPIAAKDLIASMNPQESGLPMADILSQLTGQIQKAEAHNDDAVVAVMKEVKAYLKEIQKQVLPGSAADGIIAKEVVDANGNVHGDDGKFQGKEGSSLSPTGANTFEVQGFRSAQMLNNHWKDHKAEYADDERVNSKEDYLKVALNLLQSPVGGSIVGHIDGHGNVIRYDKDTNDFAKGNPKRGVTTMYKAPLSYYENQLKGDLDHGGQA